MANGLYDFGRESYLGGDLAWDSNDVRTILIDHTDDTPVLATDQYLSDRAAPSRVDTLAAGMTSKTIVDGVADAADATHSSVTGDAADSIDIYYHTGTEGTSILICNIDTASGLPVTPNGGDIVIQWNASGIFKL